KLDARTVAALNLGAKTDAVFFDETLPRFGFRLRLSHDRKRVLRSWLVQYPYACRPVRLTPPPPQGPSAEQARTAARKILARVDLGENPAGDREERRAKDRVSLRSQVDEYLAIKTREVRSKSLREIARYLTGGYFRPLHGMPVDTISRKDI